MIDFPTRGYVCLLFFFNHLTFLPYRYQARIELDQARQKIIMDFMSTMKTFWTIKLKGVALFKANVQLDLENTYNKKCPFHLDLKTTTIFLDYKSMTIQSHILVSSSIGQ